MTFQPQYGFWAKDDLTITGGALYSHDQFKIVDGVTRVIPDNYTGDTFAYNGGPWASPQAWCIENDLDDWTDLTTDLGYYTGVTGDVSFSTYLAGQDICHQPRTPA
jgi:hypothetical protein